MTNFQYCTTQDRHKVGIFKNANKNDCANYFVDFLHFLLHCKCIENVVWSSSVTVSSAANKNCLKYSIACEVPIRHIRVTLLLHRMWPSHWYNSLTKTNHQKKNKTNFSQPHLVNH